MIYCENMTILENKKLLLQIRVRVGNFLNSAFFDVRLFVRAGWVEIDPEASDPEIRKQLQKSGGKRVE